MPTACRGANVIIPPFFCSTKCQLSVLCVAYAIGIPPTWYLLTPWFLSHCATACSIGHYMFFSALAMVWAILWPITGLVTILGVMARAIWG